MIAGFKISRNPCEHAILRHLISRKTSRRCLMMKRRSCDNKYCLNACDWRANRNLSDAMWIAQYSYSLYQLITVRKGKCWQVTSQRVTYMHGIYKYILNVDMTSVVRRADKMSHIHLTWARKLRTLNISQNFPKIILTKLRRKRKKDRSTAMVLHQLRWQRCEKRALLLRLRSIKYKHKIRAAVRMVGGGAYDVLFEVTYIPPNM
jgi:hypothetical protein